MWFSYNCEVIVFKLWLLMSYKNNTDAIDCLCGVSCNEIGTEFTVQSRWLCLAQGASGSYI